MLKSDFTGEVMVFAKEYNGRMFYQVGISKKKQDGTYENGYIDACFRKGVEVPNKTKIDIKKAWLDFYINKDKRTVPQIFISEFEMDQQPDIPSGFSQIDDDLPFF